MGLVGKITDKDRANRDLKREMISRTLEIAESEVIVAISLPELKAMLDRNEKVFDELCDLHACILASAKTAATRKSALEWLPEVEFDYTRIRQRLSERIAQLEQADNLRNRANDHEENVQPRNSVVHTGYPGPLFSKNCENYSVREFKMCGFIGTSK